MVQTMELTGVFYIHYIFYRLNDADCRRISERAAANGADFGFGDVMTHGTITYSAPHFNDGVSECFGSLRLLTQQMERQTQSGFASETRQAAQFGYRVVEQR